MKIEWIRRRWLFSGALAASAALSAGLGPACTATQRDFEAPAGCGDGAMTSGEACDDNNAEDGDGCSARCAVEPGYTCAGAPSACQLACGDGAIAGGEECDDGGGEDGDGCSAGCAVEPGYTCAGAPSACQATCGDGVIAGGEACDDDNAIDGDGCSGACAVEPGYACEGEPSECALACGDGVISAGEACDDDNAADGDGCSAACGIEPYFHCSGSPSACAPISIAYAPSDPDDPAYRAAIASITGGAVDYLDPRTVTPTLAQLVAYDCVYTWANVGFADNVAFGDLLADYVDSGRSVVLGAYSTYTIGSFLSGKIMTPDYSPVTAPSGSNHQSLSAYAGDGTTFLHYLVSAYDCTARDVLVLQGTGIQDGSYADGEIAAAYRPDFRVVYSNGTGATSIACPGDWPRLVANACAAAYLQ
jgi:cysteine-rich repeat protein